MSNEKQVEKHEKRQRKQKRKQENKRKNILNACSCCRIKKTRCTGGARCDCCTRNNLVCFYPTPKKRGPKHRQDNTPHNIHHAQKNDAINHLSKRISNVEDMLSKVSGESIDKSFNNGEVSNASFAQSATAFMNEQSALLLSSFPVNNLQYENSIDFSEDSQYFSQAVFGEQPYMLHNTLPTFNENSMFIPGAYYTTEELTFAEEPSSDEYSL
ncbi:29148_t:CDS:2 [Racocetra persica]|uniref:29148_t:CDS:1 n=1 Tax=Racocetra persica TaxID=160502 RepID=A0ACA9LR49_9GLOM|nr:29148_t:CDS:2 [Racocetra persica]